MWNRIVMSGYVNCLFTSNCITFKDNETRDPNNYFNRRRNVCSDHRCERETWVQCRHMRPIPAYTAEMERRELVHKNAVKDLILKQKLMKLRKKVGKLEKKLVKDRDKKLHKL